MAVNDNPPVDVKEDHMNAEGWRPSAVRLGVAALCALQLATAAPTSAQQPGPFVSVRLERDHFVLNGGSKFLTFVSYFDGVRGVRRLGGAAIRADFRFLKAHHVDGVRVFPNWWVGCDSHGCHEKDYPDPYEDTLLNPIGGINSGVMTALLDLLSIAREEGLVVDVSFAKEVVQGLSDGPFMDGVVAVASDARFKAFRNVILDIQNERNMEGRETFLGLEDTTATADRIHAADPGRIVTASSDSSKAPAEAGSLQITLHLNIAAYHDERNPTWFDSVPWIVDSMWYASPWTIVPYLQEPTPWDEDPDPLQHLKAAYNAKHWGAAAWLFHLRHGFNLTQARLESQLAAEPGAVEVLQGIRSEGSYQWLHDIADDDWSACNFGLSSGQQSVPASGGRFSVTLTSRWWCAWSAYVEEASGPGGWVTFPVASGVDNSRVWGGYSKSISFDVAANLGAARTALVRIGNMKLTISQAGS